MNLERFIGVDWGSSFLRAALISRDGSIIERRDAPAGASTLAPHEFQPHFDALAGDWRAQGHPALLCGMVGARRGWLEAPYLPCPCGKQELSLGLARIEAGGPDILIVPGCLYRSGDTIEVMRGEETQILGAGIAEGAICLPGTHTKWASASAGRLVGFGTALTGEIFALLRRHSSLGQLMVDEGERLSAFRRGVDDSSDAGRLLHLLFQCRSRVLADDLAAADAQDYLSGLLIGSDCRGAQPCGEVTVVGASALAARYGAALSRLGIANRRGHADAAFHGLHLIFRERFA